MKKLHETIIESGNEDEASRVSAQNGSENSSNESTNLAEEISRDIADYEIDDEIIKAQFALKSRPNESGWRRLSKLAIAPVPRKQAAQKLGPNKKDFPPTFTKESDFVISLEKDIADVDQVLYRACRYVILAWLALIAFSYWAAPKESIVWLEGRERRAALTEVCILSTAIITRHGPLFLDMKGFGAKKPQMSGVLAGGITVQFIAVSTMIWMISFPVPVMIDPVFNSRVHLIRWCEWSPLAGFMTLIVYSIEAPNLKDDDLSKRWKKRFVGASMESASTLCGLVFPFCQSKMVWCAVMVFCFVTYSSILFSYANKAKKFHGLVKGKSADEIELFDRARLSLNLHWLCCLTWSGITVMYFVGSLLHDPAATMMEECLMDTVAKILYMTFIIETHNTAFDESKRLDRRLNELRLSLSAVWENSSDTIALSVQSKSGSLKSIVSPTFFRIGLKSQHEDINDISAVMLEVDASITNKRFCSFTNVDSRLETDDLPNVSTRVIQKADFGSIDLNSEYRTAMYSCDPFSVGKPYAMKSNIIAFIDVLSRAWHIDAQESVFEHEVVSLSGNSYFEVRVTRTSRNSIISIIRDVSERYNRFEAEKKMAYEAISRQKDDQANRFAKHEIKNGLLGAIEVCEHVREQITSDFVGSHRSHASSKQLHGLISRQSLAARFENMEELDSMLHGILDIILAETMSTDIINGSYKPKLCKVDIEHVLKSTRGFARDDNQFTLENASLPILLTDLALFKCIHGNAMRNAIRYGKKGGHITTVARYEDGIFELKIINEPGPSHQKLVMLGGDASDLVFSHGTRLHEDSNEIRDGLSSGDGAWIMRKCATMLGGTVHIYFKPRQTECVFKAPMKSYDISQEENAFTISPGAWAIGIDDSKMQRKLLSRFFLHAGILEDHQIIFGRSSHEISTFVDTVVDFVQKHPDDHFLIIADENLELEGDFVSGSVCIHQIRDALSIQDEKRILALVRSANDSVEDQTLYTSRAHGFLAKIPMSAINVRGMIWPLWTKRFPNANRHVQIVPEDTPEPSKMIKRPSIENLRDRTLISSAELMAKMDQIDIICAHDYTNATSRWPLLRGKLHQLRGDLLSGNLDGKYSESIELIEAMEGEEAPPDIISRWLQIRTKITLSIK